MLKILFAHKLRVVSILFFILMLVLVRTYENSLFYDPFLEYFKKDFNNLPLPQYNSFYLVIGLAFRYGLNSLLSLGIIYSVFNEINMIKFVSILYTLFFVFLIISFFLIIYFYGNENNMMLFYIRRFLIQPIFVLLFIPAFYYQMKKK
ncbi:exosortase F system-associated protein [Flavobacterium sp. K5-23]|uniref:exosortase F system-associated membrane protein n=1 Tax=Flavobacterium sp. K5-23 TaxID=2746225 RepID=UPI00200F2D27|nr:exosortase F system-associated protein [Flavobacterium sp. K5-23]UQD55033.1 exosortase F system-associated protein [Flavobacterium sp. K5-23]